MRDERKEILIQDALNMLDDELILEADEVREKSANTVIEHGSILGNEKNRSAKRPNTRKSWRYITTLAASVAVFFIVGMVWNEVIVPNQADESIVEQNVINEDYDYPRGYQSADSVTIDNCEEVDELKDTPDVDKTTESESQMLLQSQEQIHLPNQEVEAVAGVESLRAVYIPEMKAELGVPKDVIMDMLAFFIYEGRCYVQDQYYEEGLPLVGDYVGTSVGLIDEWTAEDGYVDYAGSVAGDFYEVKGYDPSFMLCMKFDNGAVETFIHNNGISLGKGDDLIEDRLHLKGNVEKVTFKTQEEWDYSLQDEKNHTLSEEYDELMNQFLESFSSDDFVHIKDTPLDNNGTGNYHHNSDNFHITFHTKDGLRFDFVLYKDGYTRFQDFDGVCVQIDPNLYEEIISVFKSEN